MILHSISTSKYNSNFYEILLPVSLEKMKEFSLEEVVSMLISASRPAIKKRAVSRLALEFSVGAIPKLEALKSTPKISLEALEKSIYQLYKISMNYATKDYQRE